jgi:transposase
MSLQPTVPNPVPEATARVVRRAFPKGHPYLLMRDEFGVLFEDAAFAALFSHRGKPAEAPARLALVLLLQFAEGLSDRQAADAVRSRLDWKYLLGLELDDPGFDFSLLSEFRTRLVKGSAETMLFERLLSAFEARKLLKARGKQRTDATHVLAATRDLNRWETIGETMRHALNTLAEVAPQWLLAQHAPEWAERYGRRFEEYRFPKEAGPRQQLAQTMGEDGWQLLTAVFADARAGAPFAFLREVPAVETLRQVWVQQFYWEALPGEASAPAAAGALGSVRFRSVEEIPPATLLINSPYDPAARYAKKRGMHWVGYKAHLTECCDPESPLLITDVQTTGAATPDGQVVPAVHQALAQRGLLPSTHLVDSGYIDAELLQKSQADHAIDLCGPPLADTQWQARQVTGFAVSEFVIDWERRCATCPAGKTSVRWQQSHDDGNAVWRVEFAAADCRGCASRAQCTRAKTGRRLTLRPEADHRALTAARARAGTPAFAQEYARRAGVEGSLSQAVRRCGLRRSRYLGQLKTHLEHLLIAASLNFVRVANWLAGTPRAQTRESAYLRLLATAA